MVSAVPAVSVSICWASASISALRARRLAFRAASCARPMRSRCRSTNRKFSGGTMPAPAGRPPCTASVGLGEGDGLQNEVAHRQSGCLDGGPGFRTRFESRDGAIDNVAPAGNLPGGKRRAGKAVEVTLSDLPLREIRVGELVINLDRQSLARFRRRIVEKRGSSRSVPGVSIALAADSGQKDQTHGDRNQNASHETEQPQNWNRKH